MNAMDASRSSRPGARYRQAAALAALILASIALTTTASAQGKSTIVAVGVADAASGEALRGAEIIFPGLGRSVRTDAMGEVKIPDIKSQETSFAERQRHAEWKRGRGNRRCAEHLDDLIPNCLDA